MNVAKANVMSSFTQVMAPGTLDAVHIKSFFRWIKALIG